MTVCRLCWLSFFKNAPIVWLYHLNDGYLGEAGAFKKVKIKFYLFFFFKESWDLSVLFRSQALTEPIAVLAT